jgi:uncharacterized membrane protein
MAIPTELWVLAAITAVGALLRFAMLGSQSFWVDEAQAANELRMSFGSMLHSLSILEPNPPLFFVSGWVWVKIFGASEVGLRSLSALAGTALIPVTYLCGRELVSKRAGLLAAGLAAINPFMIWYSQEAREYMLLALWSGTSLLFFARWMRSRARRDLILWTAFSALALLTNYYGLLLVASEALWLLWLERNRATVAAVALLAALQAALLPHFFNFTSQDWIGAFPLAIRIKQVPVTFAMASLYQTSLVNYGLIAAAVLVAALIVLLVLGSGSRQLRGAGIAAALGGIVVLAPLVLAVLGRDYYIARALIPAWVPLAIVIGAACTIPAGRGRGVALGGAALALVLAGIFIYALVRIDNNARYQRPDWRGVAKALGTPSATRAVVAEDGRFAQEPLLFYLRASEIPGPDALLVREVDVVGSSWQTPAQHLPAGVRLIGSRTVQGYRATRFSIAGGWRLTPAQIAARAAALLGPAAQTPSVLIQRLSA